ncbi:MAG: hypothetical protein AAB227_10805 [Pseudomonadota bacterium]
MGRRTVKVATLILTSAAILTAGCGSKDPQAQQADACRTIAPSAMTETDYVCALGAEMQAIADTLALVVDDPSADRAIPSLKKSRDRIQAVVKERDRLNNEPMPGAKGAMSATKLPKLAVANRAFLKEMMRISRQHPDLLVKIGPAIEDIDI